jgi:hypothetical protein
MTDHAKTVAILASLDTDTLAELFVIVAERLNATASKGADPATIDSVRAITRRQHDRAYVLHGKLAAAMVARGRP